MFVHKYEVGHLVGTTSFYQLLDDVVATIQFLRVWEYKTQFLVTTIGIRSRQTSGGFRDAQTRQRFTLTN